MDGDGTRFGGRIVLDSAGEPIAANYQMISIVIPVFNEKESLAILYGEIAAVADGESLDLDVWFVDDGSNDGSWQVIDELSGQHARVHGIRFRRNFGKAAALSAGFGAAKGDIVFTMDADLQDDPAEIPNFLKTLDEGYDVVSGWKKVRHDPWHKVLPSRLFNRMVSWLTGVRLHDHNCGMKCYRAEVFREVKLYGELHRFHSGLGVGARLFASASWSFNIERVNLVSRSMAFGDSLRDFST